MLDIATIFLCSLAINTLLTLVLAFVFIDGLRSGMGLWTLAGALQIVGLLFVHLAPTLPLWVFSEVTPLFFSGWFILCFLGIKQFFGEPTRPWVQLVFPLVYLIERSIYHATDTEMARVVFVNTLLGLQALLCCQPLLHARNDVRSNSRYIMLFGFWMLAMSFFARVIATIWTPETTTDLYLSTSINQATMMSNMLSAVLTNVGFLLLHQDRAWNKNKQLALHDPLTGLLNRRALMDAALRELGIAKRNGSNLIIMLLDLDGFKQLNDTLGHPTGDAALQLFSGILRTQSRTSDWTARYGGEEFCVLLPNSQISDAQHLAQRIRTELQKTPLIPSGRVLYFSGGISELTAEEDSVEPSIARADAALYKAKQLGRDQVVVAT